MYVSPEMITMILTGIGTVAAVLGGGLAYIHRSQAQLEKRFDTRIDRLERKLDTVAEDVVELKVSVARLEGPQPTLLRAR